MDRPDARVDRGGEAGSPRAVEAGCFRAVSSGDGARCSKRACAPLPSAETRPGLTEVRRRTGDDPSARETTSTRIARARDPACFAERVSTRLRRGCRRRQGGNRGAEASLAGTGGRDSRWRLSHACRREGHAAATSFPGSFRSGDIRCISARPCARAAGPTPTCLATSRIAPSTAAATTSSPRHCRPSDVLCTCDVLGACFPQRDCGRAACQSPAPNPAPVRKSRLPSALLGRPPPTQRLQTPAPSAGLVPPVAQTKPPAPPAAASPSGAIGKKSRQV